MKKLLNGIIDFRRHVLPGYRDKFAQLALGQSPDTLFIACSDSRVVPNLFASTDPGDLFVLRNVGNMVAPCGQDGISLSDESEAAAIEFALVNLTVTDIVICGHSECGAMRAICDGIDKVQPQHLRRWLRHGLPTLAQLEQDSPIARTLLTPHNKLSQLNVLLQILHIQTYPVVRDAVAQGRLTIHGWWFDIAHADVYAYEKDQSLFVMIDETEAEKLLKC